jgi:SsrA-binding protein
VRGGEAFLVGMTVPAYQLANAPADYDPERPRRLLLSRKEIEELLDAESKKGLTVVPFEVYTSGRYVKARINIVRGKGKADRREDLKRLEAKKDADRAMRQK